MNSTSSATESKSRECSVVRVKLIVADMGVSPFLPATVAGIVVRPASLPAVPLLDGVWRLDYNRVVRIGRDQYGHGQAVQAVNIARYVHDCLDLQPVEPSGHSPDVGTGVADHPHGVTEPPHVRIEVSHSLRHCRSPFRLATVASLAPYPRCHGYGLVPNDTEMSFWRA